MSDTKQINIYFGIFYPADISGKILDLFADHPTYSGLCSDSAEAYINDIKLFASLNSDNTRDANIGFISADSLTIEGPEESSAEHTSITIDPAKLERHENDDAAVVSILTDIYEFIAVSLRGKKSDRGRIYCGWKAISCTWEEDVQSSSSECSPDPRPISKNVPIQAAAAIKQRAGTDPLAKKIPATVRRHPKKDK